jgi:hypothetical protein
VGNMLRRLQYANMGINVAPDRRYFISVVLSPASTNFSLFLLDSRRCMPLRNRMMREL